MVELEDLSRDLLPCGSSPLHITANSGDIKSLKLLLHSRALVSEVDVLDRHGRTPLTVALQAGRFDAAKVLVESGAKLELSFNFLKAEGLPSSKMLSIASFHQFLEGLILDDLALALNSSVFELLLRSAAYDGNALVVHKILDNYTIDINSLDNLGQSALHYASLRNKPECVEILLRFGANDMVTNPQRSTAIHSACIGGHMDIVTLFAEAPDLAKLLNFQDSQGRTPLHIALYNKRLGLFDYLVSNFRHLINFAVCDSSGYTVSTLGFMLKVDPRSLTEYKVISHSIVSSEEASWLLFDGVAHNNLELIEQSIAHGANIEIHDFMQQTPLLLASKVGGLDVFNALIIAGANPNVCDSGGKCALQYACELGNLEIALQLFSVERLDLTPFFERYNGPLTTQLLRHLTDHVTNHPSEKPKNWKRWLALASRNRSISVDIFNQFVAMICPNDWVECLTSQQPQMNCDDGSTVTLNTVQTLPALVDERSEDNEVYTRLRSTRMPLKKRKQYANKIGGAFVCMRQAAPIKVFTSFTQKHPSSFTHKKTHNKPFKTQYATSYYPVHEAATHGNVKLLEYFLSNAKECGVSLLKQLVVETTDDCGKTVAELIGQHYQVFQETTAKLGICEIVFNFVSEKWPLKINYSESLLHFIASGASLHAVGQKSSRTPLDRWPQWVFDFMLEMNHYCRDEVAEAARGENNEVILQLLDSCVEQVEFSEAGYPPLLFAAVKSNNEQIVKVLLENGVAPTAKYHGRYAITQAARNCSATIVDHFLRIGRESFHSNISDYAEFAHDLLTGLCSLVNFGYFDTVERVIFDLPLLPNLIYLWKSCRSIHLIYLLVESKSHDSLALGDALALDVASYLIKSLLPPSLVDDSQLYDSHHAMVIIKKIKSFSNVFCRCDSPNVRMLLKLATFYSKLHVRYRKYGFHFLCGHGDVELVSHFLTCLDDFYHPALFKHLDDHQQSPLYHAACGGLLDVVELLLDKGCERYYDLNENPPIKAALVFAVGSVPLHFQKVFKFSPLGLRNQCYCSSVSSTSSNRQVVGELVNLLVPTRHSLEQILHNSVHASHLLSLIALQRKLHLVRDLLFMISDVLERVGPSVLTLSHAVYHRCLRMIASHCEDDDDSFSLLDDVLAKLASHTNLSTCCLSTAAQKGLWGLVQQGLQHPPDSGCPDDSEYSHLCDVVTIAAKHGRFDIIALVYEVCLHEKEVPLRCYRPLLQAFQHDHLELSTFIHDPKYGHTFLQEAMVLSVESVLDAALLFVSSPSTSAVIDFDCLIRRCRNTDCLTVLHKYFVESCVAGFEERNYDFWFKVLHFHSSKGNIQLCREAVSSLSDAQLQDCSHQPEFGEILGSCCYWGMKDVLECLHFDSHKLLEPCSDSESLSPWEIALAMGHIGKLSWIENFPSLFQALSVIPNDSHIHYCVLGDGSKSGKTLTGHVACIAPLLFLGVANKLLSLPVDVDENDDIINDFLPLREKSAKSFVDILDVAIRLNKYWFVETCLEHVGNYASALLEKFPSFIHHACETKDSTKLLELLLDHLQDEDSLSAVLGVSCEQSPLAMLVSIGSVPSAKVLVQRLPPDILNYQLHYHYDHIRIREYTTLLHLAVLSKCTEMVDYILELLGEDAPSLCFETNSNGLSPLSLAFSLGLTHIICYSSLMTEALKYFLKSEQLNSTLVDALTHCGWFSHLLRLNTLAISGNNLNVESSETKTMTPSIARVCDFRFACINIVFTDAVRKHRAEVVSRLIALVEKCELTQKLFLNLDLETVHGLISGGYLSDISIDIPQRTLLKVITDPGREDLLLGLVKLDCILRAGLLKETFLYGCELNKSAIIQYFLKERDTNFLFEDASTIKKGLAHAVACGSFETAALIIAECGIHFDYKYLPSGVKLSEVVEMVYKCNSYYQVLQRFFSSLMSPTIHDRIPLSVAWLVHGWTKKEAEHTVRQLGGGTPLNPWTLHLKSQTRVHEVSLSIDWESFSECLIHSPRIREGSTASHIPLLVEATIFSPSVLGQISQVDSLPQGFDIFSFSEAASLSSLVLSSVTWPQEPSFSSLCEGHCILTLSYVPLDGVFLFPSPTPSIGFDNTRTMPFIDYSVESACKYLSDDLAAQLHDIAHFAANTIKKDVCKNLSVSITFSDELVDTSDKDLFTQTYHNIRCILEDIVEVLKLIYNYNDGLLPSCAPSGGSGMQHIKSYFGNLRLAFRKLNVVFKFSDEYEPCSDPYLVSFTDDSLFLQFTLQFHESGSDLLDITHSKCHSELLQCLINNTIISQIESAKCNLVKSTDTVVMHNIRNGLESFGTDCVTIQYEHSDGHMLRLCDVDTRQSIYIHLFRRLQKFLVWFLKQLKVFFSPSNLQNSICQLFEAGLNVILSEKDNTSFALRGGVPCITVNAQQLSEGVPRSVVMEVFKSLVKSTQCQQSFFEKNIPSPIVSYIDFESSPGLLYPMLNKAGKIVVQLVNYSSEIVTSLSHNDCILEVFISDRKGARIAASSSNKQTPKGTSQMLVINTTPSGQLVVEWTPVKIGVHHISILLNGIHVKGSPFKTHTLDAQDTCHRQVTIGIPVTFVVSHNLNFNLFSRRHACQGLTPPTVIHNRISIRELIEASESDTQTRLPPTRQLSSPDSLTAEGHSSVHHISMCSRYGGPRQWFHIPVGDLVIYISPQETDSTRKSKKTKKKNYLSWESFTVNRYTMSHGFTRISMHIRHAYVGEYQMFVACSKCQSVVDVLWIDQKTSLPTSISCTGTKRTERSPFLSPVYLYN